MTSGILTYWREILLVILALVVIALALPKFTKKGKKKDNAKLNAFVQNVRKNLREQHKSQTQLFRDLDKVLAELPTIMTQEQQIKQQLTRAYPDA